MVDDPGMNLDQYVKETLLTIVGGVLQAQEDAHCGAYIGRAPYGNAEHLKIAQDQQNNTIAMVSFDLATTVEDKRQAGGGLGIRVVPLFSVNAEGKGESAASLVSRIAFSVPVSIPKPESQIEADNARRRQQNAAMSAAHDRHSRSGWAG